MTSAAEAIEEQTTDETKATKGKPGRTLADPSHPNPERAERVGHILWLILDGKWEPGVTAPTLAEEWGVSSSTVEKLAVEARAMSRFVERIAEGAKQSAAELAKLRQALNGIMDRLENVEATMKGAESRSLEMKLREMAHGKR